MAIQTIQFETISPSEIGSGTITAFLFSGSTLAATLASITENGTLKGRHTGTVENIAAGDYRLVVKFDGYTVSEPDESVTLLLAVGTYVANRLAELDSTAINAVADAVLTESILDHRNVANSLAKYIWQIRQANLTIDGTVSNAITPTTLTFASNISATTSAYAHAVLLFTTGPLAGENSPIISYTNANGVFLLEEPLTAAPSDGDEFVVIAGSHVHSVADIQDGLARTGADGDTLETLSDQIDGIGGGGGGSGDATQATLLEVKAKTDLIGTAAGATTLLAAAVLEPGTITSFPETLRIGDSYTDIIGRGIQMPIVDSDGTPLTAAGSNNLADATATFVIKRANDTESSRIITGSATFIDPPGTGTSEAPYALIEISSSETSKGLVKYRYTGLLTFTWPYVGTGTDAEVMTFETGTITFEA